MVKAWYQSKTLWANVVALLGLSAQMWAGVSTDEWVVIEAGVLAVVNVALRLVTKTGLVV